MKFKAGGLLLGQELRQARRKCISCQDGDVINLRNSAVVCILSLCVRFVDYRG